MKIERTVNEYGQPVFQVVMGDSDEVCSIVSEEDVREFVRQAQDLLKPEAPHEVTFTPPPAPDPDPEALYDMWVIPGGWGGN